VPRLIAELEEVGAVLWQPQAGGKSGMLLVTLYDELAAQGRRERDQFWVPIFPEPLDDFCTSRGLRFESRSVLLRLLLEADSRTGIVATTTTELAERAGVNRRRAKQLDSELCGALQWRSHGYWIAIYSSVVRVGTPGAGSRPAAGRPRDAGRSSRAFAEGPSDDRAIQGGPSRDAGRSSREFAGVSRDPGRSASQTGRTSRDPGRSSRGFPTQPSTYLPSLPCDPPPEARSEPNAEGKEGISSQPMAGSDFVAELSVLLGPHVGDLMKSRNMHSRQMLATRAAELLDHGWSRRELLDHLTERMQGVESVIAVALKRARDLSTDPPSAQSEQARERLEAEKRQRQMEQATTYGRRRAGLDLTDDELEEDLVRVYGADSEFLHAAVTAAKEARGALGGTAEVFLGGLDDERPALAAAQGRY